MTKRSGYRLILAGCRSAGRGSCSTWAASRARVPTWPLLMLAMLMVPSALAADFSEDFEAQTTNSDPSDTWYAFDDVGESGRVDATTPISGTKSLKLEGSTGSGSLELAAGAQLTNITFTVQGITIDDDGTGSRSMVAIQSTSPKRTMVEFYIFCDDESNPTGCELRVRFDHIDTTGQVLINSTAGDSTFIINLQPDWNSGTYELEVDGVDDGTFPFLELPPNVGSIDFSKATGSKPMNLLFDEWSIQGASSAVIQEQGDIAEGLQDWATDANFTTTGSLFMLGLVFLAIITLAVAVPLISLGKDNTVGPALVFFITITVLWLVYLGWFPEWVGIALIIAVAAIIALVVRKGIMGINDASTNAGIVAGSLGYFIIATSLLGFSGYATESIEVPTSSLETPEDVEAQTNASVAQQSFTGAVAECIITFFSDCSQSTVSETWATITDVASTIFNFARTAFSFLFQLLTFQLPIPVIFSTMIVLPPAAALATVGFSFITRSGS